MFAETLKAAEPKFPSLKFEDTPIVISRENEEKTFEDGKWNLLYIYSYNNKYINIF